MQRLVYTVEIDEEVYALDGLLEALDTIMQLITDCNVIASRLESPEEVVENGDWEEDIVEHLATSIVQIVKGSCIGLDLLGKIITHKTKGEGVVVGYSSVSGEPFAFFYMDQNVSDRVCCCDHQEII